MGGVFTVQWHWKEKHVMLQTLENFMAQHQLKQAGSNSNAYVRSQGFSELYVRMGRRYLDGVTHSNVLDIARVTATNPGNGAFTRLVDDLRRHGITLYVESVLNERFCTKLLRIGFTQRDNCIPPSFYLLAEANP